MIYELWNFQKSTSYDNKDFNSNDVYDISKGTTKEDELFDYAGVPSYFKSYKNYDKDDYEISL